MKVGDLVKSKSLRYRYDYKSAIGIIIEIPPEDDYWGVTAVVEWIDGRREELEESHIKVVS